ncbi:MAG: sugar phosphate isomerase/epimerase family protein [Armatimonadota bacterium]
MTRDHSLDPTTLGFSTACFARHSIAQAAEKGGRLGFRAIELLAFDGARHSQGPLAGFWFDRMSATERQRLRAIVEPFEHVSTHAPFIDLPLFTHNPGIHEECVRQIRVAIEATAFLGGHTTTMHINSRTQCQYGDYVSEVIETLRALGDAAAAAGVTITVETGFPSSNDAFVETVMAVGHPAVGANVDVGHIVGHLPAALRGTDAGKEMFEKQLLALVRALGDKAYHFHLHDVRANDFRDHRRVGVGVVPFPALFRLLTEMGYDGLLIFELEEPDFEAALSESRDYVLRCMTGAT